MWLIFSYKQSISHISKKTDPDIKEGADGKKNSDAEVQKLL